MQARGTPAFQFGTTASFGIANINGEVARVMKFPGGSPSQGFVLSHGGSPNGGGAKINRYTLVMDVLFPSSSTGYRCLWQTDTSDPTNTDGDLFVNPADGVAGISGQYHGHLTPDAWHRVVFTIDLVNRELGKFIDGINVLSGPVGSAPLGTNQMQYLDPVTGSRDGRWSLETTGLLFADETRRTPADTSTACRFGTPVSDRAESPIWAGRRRRHSVAVPATPTLRLVSPNGGENLPGGQHADRDLGGGQSRRAACKSIFSATAASSRAGTVP